MKAKVEKSGKASKSVSASSAIVRKAPKPPAKPVVKPTGKTVAKSAPKVATKPKTAVKLSPKRAVQPPVKKVAKPVAKVVVKKPISSPAVKQPPVKSKVPVKSTAKASSRPVAKPVGKPVAQPVAKPSAKQVAKPIGNPAFKPGVKPVVMAAVKSDVKAVSKPDSKPVLNAEAKPVHAVTPKKPAAAASSAATPAPTTPVVQPKAALASNGLPVPPPLKPGRRSSSRALAHMPPPAPMVPTHAPDAAKASYSTMTERVIAPPPHVAAKKDPKLANNWKTKAFDALSDEEIKAMPDVEYMNEKQLAFFRFKLSILKQDIHNSAGATTEHLREDTAVVPDPADRATIEEEHALELRTRDRERKLLKKIEQSIARIDSGDYGYCDETGEPIGLGRLIARPTASLSLEAQQRRELKQKMFGD